MALNTHTNGSTMILFVSNRTTVDGVDCLEVTATLPDNSKVYQPFWGKDAHNEAKIQRYKYQLIDRYCHF